MWKASLLQNLPLISPLQLTGTSVNVSIKFSFKDFIYFVLERGEGKEKERERNITAWLPLMRPLLGDWPATQACALTGNRTIDLSVCGKMPNPLRHTSQGASFTF